MLRAFVKLSNEEKGESSMALYSSFKFTRFSTPDVERFEKRLIKWCKDAYIPGISMILFDITSLKVGDEATLEEFNGETFYKIKNK